MQYVSSAEHKHYPFFATQVRWGARWQGVRTPPRCARLARPGGALHAPPLRCKTLCTVWGRLHYRPLRALALTVHSLMARLLSGVSAAVAPREAAV